MRIGKFHGMICPTTPMGSCPREPQRKENKKIDELHRTNEGGEKKREKEKKWQGSLRERQRERTSVSHLGRVDVDNLPSILVGPSGVVSQALSGLGDIESSGKGERLSVVERLNGGELVGVLVDQVRELEENL
jgi:hypothetical protein